MQKDFYIALGGALGSLTRYWVGSTIGNRMRSRYPFGTFIINPACRFLVPAGFVGDYSAFFTFESETFSSLQTGAFLTPLPYVVLSFFLGLVVDPESCHGKASEAAHRRTDSHAGRT